MRHLFPHPVLAFVLAVLVTASVVAQRGGPPQPPPTPRVQAAFDITGYWVSLVNEDWRYRMATPPKGDVAGVPLNGAGRQAAEAWDPAKDESAGESCRAYGAAGVMRQPGRLHIEWTGDDALSVETDAGTQTRVFQFGQSKPPSGPPTWQGYSVASWEYGGFGRSNPASPNLNMVGKPRGGSLMTEYFDRFDLPNGDALLVVSTEVADPAYLVSPFWTSTHFKKQRDAAGWNPRPCSAR